jgi:hypothetical protein
MGLLNWKNHTPSYTEKPQAMVDLIQSIIQTHNPTWHDCRQLLQTLLSTEGWRWVIQASLLWLTTPPSGTNDVQAYTQMAFPEAETTWDPNEPGG